MSMPMLTPEQMAVTPAAPPPPGVTPNFVNPESRSPGATAAVVIVLALLLIVLCMRLYSRMKLARAFGVDDWLALASGVVAIPTAVVCILALNAGGLGPHMWNVPLIDFVVPAFQERLFALQILSGWVGAFAKLSILCFLLRIFPRTLGSYVAWLVYIGLAIESLFIVIFTVTYGVICAPRNGVQSCSTDAVHHFGETTAVVNMAIDLYVLALAIPSIFVLQMSMRRKFGIVLVLSTGLIACVCSIMVLYYTIGDSADTDVSWSQVPLLTLASLEPFVALITACLPALPAVWAHISVASVASFRRLLSRVSGSSRSRTGHGQSTNSAHGHELGSRDTSSQSDVESQAAKKIGASNDVTMYNGADMDPTARNRYD